MNLQLLNSISLENEMWKPIKNYEDKYFVSTLGRVAVLNTTGIKLLKGEVNNTPQRYLRIGLYRHSKRERKFIHRIVAETFIPNYYSYPFVDHINGDTKDNRVVNLRWCTRQQNIDNPNTRIYCGKHLTKNVRRIRPVVAYNNQKKYFYNSIADARQDGYTYNYIANAIKSGKKYKNLFWKDA